jgi:hypothetical protein
MRALRPLVAIVNVALASAARYYPARKGDIAWGYGLFAGPPA